MVKKIFNDIRRYPKFERDLKQLKKKFRSLEDDIDTFIDTELKMFHKLNIDNKGILPIPGFGVTKPKIYKVKKFACKSLKGRGVNSGIRMTYVYFEQEDVIEFIEIYHKSNKVNEDRQRIKIYIKELK